MKPTKTDTGPQKAASQAMTAFGSGGLARGHFGNAASPRFGGSLMKDNRGIAMIEYAMLCAVVALTILAVLIKLGGGVGANFNDVDNGVGDSLQFQT